jgi:hypothetical protein
MTFQYNPISQANSSYEMDFVIKPVQNFEQASPKPVQNFEQDRVIKGQLVQNSVTKPVIVQNFCTDCSNCSKLCYF